MAREKFSYELQQLEADVLGLGHLVQKALIKSVQALKERDLTKAQRIIADDEYINPRGR